jgi:hypothetical protein
MPMANDSSIGMAKGLKVNIALNLSRQFCSYLISKGLIEAADSFIHPCPT